MNGYQDNGDVYQRSDQRSYNSHASYNITSSFQLISFILIAQGAGRLLVGRRYGACTSVGHRWGAGRMPEGCQLGASWAPVGRRQGAGWAPAGRGYSMPVGRRLSGAGNMLVGSRQGAGRAPVGNKFGTDIYQILRFAIQQTRIHITYSVILTRLPAARGGKFNLKVFQSSRQISFRYYRYSACCLHNGLYR